jgi:hypothetical protein
LYRALLYGAVAIGLLNFVMYLIGAHIVGGGPAYVDDGHYFVRNLGTFREAAGTRITEVSKADFDYVTWHANSLLITHPLVLIAGALLAHRPKRKPSP